MNDIVNVINSVGFPIAACVALYYQNIQSNKMYEKMVEEFSAAVNANTKTLSELVEKLRKDPNNNVWQIKSNN